MTTILGQAEIEIRATGTSFASDATRVARPALASLGAESEHQAARGRRAFSVMFGTIRDSASGAFGPVTDILGHIDTVLDDIKQKSVGLRTTAVGAAGFGVGTGLQAFASKEQAAQAQLSDAIDHTGHTYEEYGDQIEKTVKHGEHFGVQSYQTMDVLNRLTLATNDPAKALKDYQVILDMAAARHMSVTRAAQMLASAYGGNTRVFRMFGLNVADGNKALAAAKKADDAATTAGDKLKKARQNLADVEARLGASRQGHKATADQLASAEARVATATAAVQTIAFKHGQASPQYAAASARLAAAEDHLATVRGQGTGQTKLTVSQEIELRKAHEAVTEAERKVTEATKTKTQADKDAAGATHGADGAVNQLSQRLSGQASAAASTFTGHLRALGAEVEDKVSQFGKDYGPAITAASTATMALGSAVTIGQAVLGRFGTAGRAAAAANTVFTATEEVQTAATAASTEATVALTTAESTLAEVDVALGGASGEAAVGIAAEGTAAAATAVEMGGLGAASGAMAAETAASAGGVAALGGALGTAAAGLVAFGASYEGTTMLLKHTPLGGAVRSAADAVGNFLGFGGHATAKLGQSTNDVIAFAKSRHETLDQLMHDPAGMAALSKQTAAQTAPDVTRTAGHDDSRSELHAIHMALLGIQHNTAKTSQHTHDTHRAIIRAGSGRPISPELATL